MKIRENLHSRLWREKRQPAADVRSPAFPRFRMRIRENLHSRLWREKRQQAAAVQVEGGRAA
jgi:hypothetical protein